jgi:hypothetical protein
LIICFAVGGAFGDAGNSVSFREGDKNSPKWTKKRIVISISDSVWESQLDPEMKQKFASVVRASFEKWSPDSGIAFEFKKSKQRNVSSKRSGGDGISLVTIAPTAANLLLFGEKRTNLSAITRVFFDSRGNIKEADIVLNPTARFTRDGSRGTFDLESTMTHEAGHVIGIPHSGVVGATMHKRQGRNGVFGLAATYARTLSDGDRVSARSIYRESNSLACACGSISGDLTANGRDLKPGAFVWAESVVNGRVVASSRVLANGHFELKQVPTGDYDLFATAENGKRIFSSLTPVRVDDRRAIHVDRKDFEETAGGKLSAFGFNGQISNLAIPVERGHRFLMSVAIQNLDPGSFSIESSSPGMHISNDSIALQYKAGNKSVLSFEVFVSHGVRPGDYSLRVMDGNQLIGHAAGVVTVDQTRNPWYSTIF